MLGDLRRDFVIIFIVILTIAFYFLIPIFIPGFPTPAISRVGVSGISTDRGAVTFAMHCTIANQGTSGNVVVKTMLMNASRHSVESRSLKTVYMNAGEETTVDTTVQGSSGEPYDIVVEADRKSALNPGF